MLNVYILYYDYILYIYLTIKIEFYHTLKYTHEKNNYVYAYITLYYIYKINVGYCLFGDNMEEKTNKRKNNNAQQNWTIYT